jgi:integrase
MATFVKRTTPDGVVSYLARVRLKGQPEQVATFRRLTDARKWAASTESAIREGRHFLTAESKRHTVADLVDRYEREILSSKRSYAVRAQHLAYWRGTIGDRLLADVRPALLKEQQQALRRGRSDSTVNRYLASLSHAFTVAVKEWEWIESNPFQKISALAEPEGRVRFLTDDERARLLAACQEHSDTLHTLVALSLATGARKAELLGLTWPAVDLKRGLVTFEQTKSGKRRSVPVAGAALALLRAVPHRIDTPLLFPSPHNKRRPINVQNIFTAAVKRAGITDFRWHDLRHSAASYLVAAGVHMKVIQEILGHHSVTVTEKYSHLADGHLLDAVKRVDALLK